MVNIFNLITNHKNLDKDIFEINDIEGAQTIYS